MDYSHTPPALVEAQAKADAAWVALGLTIYAAALAANVAWLDEEDSRA